MAGPFLACFSSTMIFLVFAFLTCLSHGLSIPRELRERANTTLPNSPSTVPVIQPVTQRSDGTGNVCNADVKGIPSFDRALNLRLPKRQVCGPNDSPYYQYTEGASDITLGEVNFKLGQKAPFQGPPDTKCG
ncbi:hypothetical protein B0H15DRAFT_832764 [Mycena belliarum]|uniref:Uncharacterized protein n=1 Tax=Mycena belliarum TaxID=1033014 RepID=A0AAD6UC12_9AGAR|nr:hypothetical protein B0H15DRAFT_832764 [Mycena belliae]